MNEVRTTAPGAADAKTRKRRRPRGRGWIAHVSAAAVVALFVVAVTVGPWSGGATVGDIPILLLLGTTLAVGWLIAWKRPRNALGWLLIAVPALFILQPVTALAGEALRDTAPPVAAWLLWYGADREDTWMWVLPVGLLLTQIPLRFPDGRLPSRNWRWFSWLTIVVIAFAAGAISTTSRVVAPGIPNPTYVPGLADQPWLLLLVFGSLAAGFLGSVASLGVRYRRADATERAQLRWVFWAVAVAVGVLVLGWVVPNDLVDDLVIFAYALIPIAIGFAVLRYRLYEIDRIISRTAAYAIVTLLVVAVYVVVVTSVTWLFPAAPAVAVALATLAAAALFLPALRGIRRVVDRRFDRAHYDAGKVVDAFGQRLRDGADPHTTATDLVEAVDRTLQPESIGLWVVR